MKLDQPGETAFRNVTTAMKEDCAKAMYPAVEGEGRETERYISLANEACSERRARNVGAEEYSRSMREARVAPLLV